MNILALSQGEFGHSILQDIGLICLIGIILAGLIHGWLRQASPGLQWNQVGKVSTVGLGPWDILSCLLLLLIPCAGLFTSYRDPDLQSINVSGILFQSFIMILLATAVVFIFHQRGLLPQALGLHPKHPIRVILWAVLGWIVIFISFILLNKIGLELWLSERLGAKQNQEVVDVLISTPDSQLRLTMIFMACIVAPVTEEFLFRGYLYPVVKRFTEPVVAAIFTGVIFGAIHGQIWAVIPLSIFGILLALLYEKSGSIWACILCHGMFNTINVFFMLTMGDKL